MLARCSEYYRKTTYTYLILARCVEYYYKRRDRLILTDYFRMTSLCYFKMFEDVYKTFTNVSQAYFLPSSNKTLNMVTLKPKLFSPRSRVSIRHVAHVLENYSQIRIRSSVLLLDKYFIFYHSVFAPKICQC